MISRSVIEAAAFELGEEHLATVDRYWPAFEAFCAVVEEEAGRLRLKRGTPAHEMFGLAMLRAYQIGEGHALTVAKPAGNA